MSLREWEFLAASNNILTKLSDTNARKSNPTSYWFIKNKSNYDKSFNITLVKSFKFFAFLYSSNRYLITFEGLYIISYYKITCHLTYRGLQFYQSTIANIFIVYKIKLVLKIVEEIRTFQRHRMIFLQKKGIRMQLWKIQCYIDYSNLNELMIDRLFCLSKFCYFRKHRFDYDYI